jgi:hypothetical protein
MKRLSWRQWVVVAAFLLAIAGTGIFATRTVRRALYWQAHRDEPIREWMSVRYVAHSYRVPPPVLYQAIGLPPQPHDRRPLREIARERNLPVEDLVKQLEDAIARFRSQAPVPPPDRGKSP